MKLAITDVYYQESPLYQVTYEDHIGDGWCYLIVAETEQGRFTHYETFEYYDKDRVQAFVSKIAARGFIDTAYWSEGTAWDYYATPQTYEEEKAEALFNEYA